MYLLFDCQLFYTHCLQDRSFQVQVEVFCRIVGMYRTSSSPSLNSRQFERWIMKQKVDLTDTHTEISFDNNTDLLYLIQSDSTLTVALREGNQDSRAIAWVPVFVG